MTIVCLGWGSLVWKPESLPVVEDWHSDGPALPIEFARESMDGRMTLVITKGSPAIPVLWTKLRVQSLEEAKDVLAAREGIPAKNIERDIGFCGRDTSFNHDDVQSIAAWAASKNIDAVVWTALPPGFKKGRGSTPTADEVIAYLGGLQGNARLLAEEYVRRAPEQVHTPYRAAIERELKWERMPAGRTIVLAAAVQMLDLRC